MRRSLKAQPESPMSLNLGIYLGFLVSCKGYSLIKGYWACWAITCIEVSFLNISEAGFCGIKEKLPCYVRDILGVQAIAQMQLTGWLLNISQSDRNPIRILYPGILLLRRCFVNEPCDCNVYAPESLGEYMYRSLLKVHLDKRDE